MLVLFEMLFPSFSTRIDFGWRQQNESALKTMKTSMIKWSSIKDCQVEYTRMAEANSSSSFLFFLLANQKEEKESENNWRQKNEEKNKKEKSITSLLIHFSDDDGESYGFAKDKTRIRKYNKQEKVFPVVVENVECEAKRAKWKMRQQCRQQ